MEKIVIGFSRSRSPWKIGSKVIQEVEKRDFSHAYVKFIEPITNIELIAQASNGFVNMMAPEFFELHNVVVEEYEVELSDSQFLDIIKFIYSNLGKNYSYLQLVLIGIKKLFRIELNQLENKDMSYICSEFAARLLQIANKDMPEHLDFVTPSDLREIITSNSIGKRIK